jgi:hypothetical protein
MNTAPGLEFWWHLAVMLASEMLVIVLIAFAWQTVTASAVWRRTIWQTCALGFLTLLAVELSGGSRVVAGWRKSQQSPVQASALKAEHRTFSVTIGDWSQGSSASDATSIPVLKRTAHSWWPGILWLAGFALLIGRMLFVRIFFLLHGTRLGRSGVAGASP